MSKRATRTQSLKPNNLIDIIKKYMNKALNEVVVRRSISALYFALFNYWSAKAFEKGERGRGTLQDSFSLSKFHSDIRTLGLDPYIKLIYEGRVAVNHYTLNPTKAKIYNGHKEYDINIKIDKNYLNKILKASEVLLKKI